MRSFQFSKRTDYKRMNSFQFSKRTDFNECIRSKFQNEQTKMNQFFSILDKNERFVLIKTKTFATVIHISLHTHTCTHIPLHTHPCTHKYMQTHTCTHTYLHTDIHVHTKAFLHTHIHPQTHTCPNQVQIGWYFEVRLRSLGICSSWTPILSPESGPLYYGVSKLDFFLFFS